MSDTMAITLVMPQWAAYAILGWLVVIAALTVLGGVAKAILYIDRRWVSGFDARDLVNK